MATSNTSLSYFFLSEKYITVSKLIEHTMATPDKRYSRVQI